MFEQILDIVIRLLGGIISTLLEWSQEDWFPYVSFIWLLVGILYDLSRNKSLLKAVQSLLRQPLIDTRCNPTPIAQEDKGMEGAWIPLYPRELLEQLSCRLMEFFTFPVRKWVYPILHDIADKVYPLGKISAQSTFISLIFTLFLLSFAYGDTIAIANGLAALGLVRGEIPEILLYYERAVAAASFFAIIVGFFVLIESYVYMPARSTGPNANNTDEERQPLVDFRSPEMGRLLRGLSAIVIVLGIIVSFLLGMGRLQALGYWESSEALSLAVQFGVNVLTLVNGLLAAALVFVDGIKGLQALVALFMWAIIGILLLFDVFAFLFVRVFAFSLDMAWRLVLMILLLAFFIFFRPPEGIVKLLWRTLVIPPVNFIKSAFSSSTNNSTNVTSSIHLQESTESNEGTPSS